MVLNHQRYEILQVFVLGLINKFGDLIKCYIFECKPTLTSFFFYNKYFKDEFS